MFQHLLDLQFILDSHGEHNFPLHVRMPAGVKFLTHLRSKQTPDLHCQPRKHDSHKSLLMVGFVGACRNVGTPRASGSNASVKRRAVARIDGAFIRKMKVAGACLSRSLDG